MFLSIEFFKKRNTYNRRTTLSPPAIFYKTKKPAISGTYSNKRMDVRQRINLPAFKTYLTFYTTLGII